MDKRISSSIRAPSLGWRMLKAVNNAVLAAGAPFSLTVRETYAQPQDADAFLTRQWRRHIDTVEQLRRFRPPPATVLDVGCGTGALSSRLAELGYAMQGCDCLPPDGVNVAPAGFVYSQVDLDNEGLSPHYATSPPFDAVVCSDVIEHLENPAKALREIGRVLHQNGLAFITLPNAFNIFERAAIALTGNSTRYKFSTPAERGHISMLPHNVMHALAARAGLEVVAKHGGYCYLGGYFIRPKRRWSPLLSYSVLWILRKQN